MNILPMFVTWLVSNEDKSWLNVLDVEQASSLNKYDISVTALVSHVLMWPYVLVAVVASLHHAVTAVRRLAVSNR